MQGDHGNDVGPDIDVDRAARFVLPAPSAPLDHQPELRVAAPPIAATDAKLAERTSFASAPGFVHRFVPRELEPLVAPLWDLAAAVAIDELKDRGRTERTRRDLWRRVLERLRPALEQSEIFVFHLAIEHPLPAQRWWDRPLSVSAGTGMLAATAEEVAVLTLSVSGLAVGFAAQLVTEIVETYAAACARRVQYVSAGRSPDAAMLAADVALVGGAAVKTGDRALVQTLVEASITHIEARLLPAGLPVAGIVYNGWTGTKLVRKVQGLGQLQPSTAAERLRQADDQARRVAHPRGPDVDSVIDLGPREDGVVAKTVALIRSRVWRWRR